ncbi:hypothetical protein [Citreimonas salinaria]|nr:hypothetical protein [Citreimonas salinaria]
MPAEAMKPTATCAPDLRSRIYALSHDMTMLVGLIEGASVLSDTVDGGLVRSDNPVARRAANAMPPMFERIIAEANRINGELDKMEMKGFHHGA